MHIVCIWPDGTWCDEKDLWKLAYLSLDDYKVEALSDIEYKLLLEGELSYGKI